MPLVASRNGTNSEPSSSPRLERVAGQLAGLAVELEAQHARPSSRSELAVRRRDLEARRLVAGVRLEPEALEVERLVDRVVRQAGERVALGERDRAVRVAAEERVLVGAERGDRVGIRQDVLVMVVAVEWSWPEWSS